MLKTFKLLWNIKTVKKDLIEDNISECQKLVYYIIITSISWLTLTNTDIPFINKMFELVMVILHPLICFLIYKKYNMKNFFDTYVCISYVTGVRIFIYIILTGVILGIIIALIDQSLLGSLLEYVTKDRILVNLSCMVISILYTVWHYYDLARQYKKQVSS